MRGKIPIKEASMRSILWQRGVSWSSSSSPTSSAANRKGPSRRPGLTLPIPQRDPTLAVPLPFSPSSNSAPPTSHNSNQTQRPHQLINFWELERHNRIGSGSGGTVYKVVHRATSRVFALKVIHGKHDDSVRSQIRREIEILRHVDHPNVVKCYDMYDHNGEIEVLLEFMDCGSLEGYHIAQEYILVDLARQILSGLAYLHRRHIVHHDIKPSNLLINSRKDVKIADFGVSRILAQTMDSCNSSAGTIAYMSPERINTDLDHGKYGEYAGDIWSFGVSILEFSLGRFPFSVGRQGDWASLMCAICFSEPPQAPASASREFRNFIDCCLQRDPHRRWTAAQLLQHPFILRGGRGQNQKIVGLRDFRRAAESTDESEDVDILKVFHRQKMYAAVDQPVAQVLSIVNSPETHQQYGGLLETNQQAKVRGDKSIGWNDEKQVSPCEIYCSLSLPSKIHSSPGLEEHRTSQPDISIPNTDAARLSLESFTCSEGEVTESFRTTGDVSQPLDIVLQAQAPKSPDTNNILSIMPRETLEYFEIDTFSSFERLLRSNFTVKQLKISKCPDLVLLLPLMLHTSLESLEFNCCSFFSLSFSNFYPPTLKRLKIADCLCSELILKVLMDQKGLCLESLEIEGCSSLISFPIDKLPATIRGLKIVNCMNLKSLRASSKIRNCDSVDFGPDDDSSIENMTSTSSLELKEFEIWDCVELEFLPEGLKNFAHLDMLSISNCPSLECFPEGGLPNTSLKSLLISECENLKSLPHQIHKIKSLQILNVSGCPSLTSFPEGGLPPNLVSLHIIDCENLIPLSHWELHKLKLLNKYSIIGGCPDPG